MKIERDFSDKDYVKEISIEQFRNSGLLWFVNSILHAFGVGIACDPDTQRLYPAITRYRGFNEKNNDLGYRRMTLYMNDNAEDLLKDCEADERGEAL